MLYFCAVVWLLAGLLLLFRMGKENRVFYFLGGYFLFLAIWWGAAAATGLHLFTGGWGIALRIVTAAALAVACAALFRQKRRDGGNPGPSGK